MDAPLFLGVDSRGFPAGCPPPPADVVVRRPLPGGVRAHVSTAVPFTHLAAAAWAQGPWWSLASVGLAPAAISLAPQRSDGAGRLCVRFGRWESCELPARCVFCTHVLRSELPFCYCLVDVFTDPGFESLPEYTHCEPFSQLMAELFTLLSFVE